MARSHTPTDLGALLDSFLTRKEWWRRLRLHQIFLFWDEVVGREIGRHAEPQVIRGDVLWLAVSDSIWMQQLQFEKVHLLSLLNARLGEEWEATLSSPEDRGQGPLLLADLRFQLEPSLGRRPRALVKAPVVPVIDHEQFTRFSESLNSIPDQGLRESMKRLWLAQHRRS